MKKVFAVILALVFSFVAFLPVHAESYVSKSTIWNWFANTFPDSIIPYFLGTVCPSSSGVCSSSEDHQHHSNGYLQDLGGDTYMTVCQYCGHDVTVRGTDLTDAYDSYTQQLPATGINSAGKILWSPIYGFASYRGSGGYGHYYGSYELSYKYHDYSYSRGEANCDWFDDHCFLKREGNLTFYSTNFFLYYKLPIKGYYSLVSTSGTVGSGYYLDSTGARHDIPFSFNGYSTFSGLQNADKESFCHVATVSSFSCSYFEFTMSGVPVYEVTPFGSLVDPSAGIYGTSTRPSSFGNSGALGIQTGDGVLQVLDHSNIIDETNNTYYNPVTQTDNSISSWTYDYSTRTYIVTLDNGDTVTVNYGDENITINEGDTVYNVYYVIQGTGPDPTPTPGPGGETHKHNYTSEDTKAPTCTMPGTRTYTCSECGDTYTKAIPATGHDWQVKTEVKTEYGEDGELIQEGYTIYQCSVCGEEYKSTPQTGPPPSGGGSGDSGDDGGGGIDDALGDLFGVIGDIISGLFGGAVELLTSLVAGLGDMFKTLMEFSSGFGDFLTGAFGFVPPEIISALSAGIILMVVFAIIKFIGGFL